MTSAGEQLVELRRGAVDLLLEADLKSEARAAAGRWSSRRVSIRRPRTCISGTPVLINKMRQFQQIRPRQSCS